MHTTRQLLLVDPCEGCLGIAPYLEGNHWTIVCSSLNAVNGRHFDVGLVRLRADHLKRPEILKNVLAMNGGEWLAVVTQESMDSPTMRNFIAEWFFDYHTLPLDPERVCIAIGHAYGMAKLRIPVTRPTSDHTLIGDSHISRELNALIAKLAPTDTTILIRGESGTGKELVAQALHKASRRSAGPFVPLNCGAITENLIQSELFGHEKGAFTGAHQRKIGRIEQAHGGTLLLDEIGDLPMELQANLLRFLQEGQIERVGSGQTINVDVRIMAATHIDLEQAVERNLFREDLYYRLNVLQIRTTNLRDRPEDIPVLARHFSALYAKEIGRRPRNFSDTALAAMLQYSWPGNVRELANRVRRGMAMADGRSIQPADMGLESISNHRAHIDSLKNYILDAEARALSDALALYSNNASRAAAALGVSRPTFYRLLHKHGLR